MAEGFRRFRIVFLALLALLIAWVVFTQITGRWLIFGGDAEPKRTDFRTVPITTTG